MISFVQQRSLATFVILAFLFSWWTWPLAALGLPLFAPGPNLGRQSLAQPDMIAEPVAAI